jgi:hypothetical protein
MDYRGDIEYIDDKGHKVALGWSQLCATTLDALHAMHRFAQCEFKPRLRADQYRIAKLGIVYKDEGRDQWGVKKDRYEAIAIPTGPNEPIVKRVKAEPHPDFPFVDEKLLNESQKLREASAS